MQPIVCIFQTYIDTQVYAYTHTNIHAANSMLISIGDVLLAVDPGDGRCNGKRPNQDQMRSCDDCYDGNLDGAGVGRNEMKSCEGGWIDVSGWKNRHAARIVIGVPGTCVRLRMQRGDGSGMYMRVWCVYVYGAKGRWLGYVCMLYMYIGVRVCVCACHYGVMCVCVCLCASVWCVCACLLCM